MDFEAFLLGGRMLCHLATAIAIAAYVGSPGKHRVSIGIGAWLLAGSSFAESARILLNWDEMIIAPIQPWLIIISLSVLYIVLRAGGNLAKIMRLEQ